MRLGICCFKPEYFAIAKAAGFDYVEGSLMDIAKMDDAEWSAYKQALLESGLQAECFCCAFSGLDLVGDGVNYEAIAVYFDHALSRAAELGAQVVVIGSGGARNVPDGYDREKAIDQFCRVLNVCGDIAKTYNIRVVIEPLGPKETNLVNTVAEGKEMVRRAAHSHVGCLVDFYHTYRSGETLDAVRETASPLWHAHIARANDDRGVPLAEDVEQVKIWATALKESGYDARLSVEAVFAPDFETAAYATRPIIECFK